MPKKKPTKKLQSLFSSSSFAKTQRSGALLWTLAELYDGYPHLGAFDQDEAGRFEDQIESEISYYTCYFHEHKFGPWISGPIKLEANGHAIDFGEKGPYCFPRWAEEDAFTFRGCEARSVLMVEKPQVANRLLAHGFCQKTGLALVSSFGIPRPVVRRFLHRLCIFAKIPLYILADSGPWGFALFSVMKRGLLAPTETCPYLAVAATRFLGLRVQDAALVCPSNPRLPMSTWFPTWTPHMDGMKKYSCFASKHWKDEFRAFAKRNGGMELETVRLRSTDWLIALIEQRIAEKDWLD